MPLGYAAEPCWSSGNNSFANGLGNQWLQIDIGRPVKLRRYTLRRRNVTAADFNATSNPRDWTLQGSQDGSSWVAVDSQTDSLNPVFAGEIIFSGLLDDVPEFRFYRINITRIHGTANHATIGALHLLY